MPLENISHVGPWLLGKILGEGNTSVVRIGTHENTNTKVAVKIVDKNYLNAHESRWNQLRREIAIMKLGTHQNMLQLHEVREDKNAVFLILELVEGGSLYEFIITNGHLTQRESIRFLGQIVMGIEHLYTYGICHRDLKPENVLLDKKKKLKIIDCGLAQVTYKWRHILLKTPCGSPHYAAPEVIADDWLYDGHKSDVWSLGVILYAMCTGMLPFVDNNISTLMQMIAEAKYEIPFFISPLMSDLITSMLTHNPKKRILLNNIRMHPIFKFLCPDLYVSPSSAVPRIPGTSITSIQLPFPWNNNEELNYTIVKFMDLLGWGTVQELAAALLDNEFNISNHSHCNESSALSRVDRKLYLLLKQKLLLNQGESRLLSRDTHQLAKPSNEMTNKKWTGELKKKEKKKEKKATAKLSPSPKNWEESKKNKESKENKKIKEKKENFSYDNDEITENKSSPASHKKRPAALRFQLVRQIENSSRSSSANTEFTRTPFTDSSRSDSAVIEDWFPFSEESGTSTSTSYCYSNEYQQVPEDRIDKYAYRMFEKPNVEYVCVCTGNTSTCFQATLKILNSKGLIFRIISGSDDEEKCISMETCNMKIKIIPWNPLKNVYRQHMPQQCFMQFIRMDKTNIAVPDFRELFLSILHISLNVEHTYTGE